MAKSMFDFTVISKTIWYLLQKGLFKVLAKCKFHFWSDYQADFEVASELNADSPIYHVTKMNTNK